MTEITISAVGDVFTGGLLSEEIEKYKNIFLSEEINKIFKSSDICFCNLESPLCKLEDPPEPNKTLLYAKGESIEYLKKSGFNVVSLANNHTMDFGWKSLQKTIKILEKNKIGHVGAGKNINEARKPVILEINKIKVAFLGYSWALPMVEEGSIAATKNSPGISPYNLKFINEDIKKIRKGVDYIFLSIHWQYEFSHYPPPQIISEAHQIIDAGADVILAHHPHVLQGFEKYKNGLIFYSLSNFLFSPWFATNSGRWINYENNGKLRIWYKDRRKGLILKFVLSKNKNLNYKMIPTLQEREPVVKIQSEKNAKKTVRRMNKWSLEYGKKYYEKNYEKLIENENKLKYIKAIRNEIETYGFVATFKKAKNKFKKIIYKNTPLMG